MSYVDLNTIHNPATGTVPPASWGDQIRDNFEHLVDPPCCSVSNSTVTSVATSSIDVLPFDTEQYDNDGMHSTVTNNSRITATTAGRYLFTANLSWVADPTGSRQVYYSINGGAQISRGAYPACGGGVNTVIVATWTVVLAATDYVQIFGWQNRGSNLQVAAGVTATWFTR